MEPGNDLLAVLCVVAVVMGAGIYVMGPAPHADRPAENTTETPTERPSTDTPTPTPVGTEGPCVTVSARNTDVVCP